VGEYFPGERAASAPSAPSSASLAAGSLSSHLASGNGPIGIRERRRQRLCVAPAVLVLLLVASAPVALGSMPPLGAVAGESPGQELIQFPLRWCAVEGSPAAATGTDTDGVLQQRMEDASQVTWLTGANIIFRSAFTHEFQDESNFPIIKDPNPDGPGELGDIEYDSDADDHPELDDVVSACEVAWEQVAIDQKVPVVGAVVVNIREFVNGDGEPSDLIGSGLMAWRSPSDYCLDPSDYTTAGGGDVVVNDASFAPTTPAERSLAHELGHLLDLEHGNGLDDDDDGWIDAECDSDEDPEEGPPFSLMTQSSVSDSARITPFQRNVSRGVAAVYIGATLDSPVDLTASHAIGDLRTDPNHDVADESADLVWASQTFNAAADVTQFVFALDGLVSRSMPRTRYLAFFDIDANPATAGAPSSLGFPTDMQGAEVVVSALVEPPSAAAAPFEVEATVWVFDGSEFAVLTDPRIRGNVETLLLSDGENDVPERDVISVEVPSQRRGPVGRVVLIQAVAEQLDAPYGFDVLPGDQPVRSGDAAPLFLIAPTFPVCGVTPVIVAPGETAMVQVSGLVPNRPVHVNLGSEPVAAGSTGATGNALIDFAIPTDTDGGPHLVTVGVDGLALTADCTVDVFFQVE
jgi:hypothetical protein